MSSKTKFEVVTVSINELNSEMTILAYTGFSNRYAALDHKVLAFLHHNFSGAKSLVIREGNKVFIPVEEIREGDSLLQIFSFPSSKKNLTKAHPKLISALKKKEVLRFKVKRQVKLPEDYNRDLQEAINQVNLLMRIPSKKQERRDEGIRKSTQLVAKIEKSTKQRKEGSEIIENMMDNARRGNIKSSDIEAYVETVISSASAEAMSAIVNLKASDHTYCHCIDVGVLFQHIYFKCIKISNKKSAFSSVNEALLGAFLHDFGKSQIPKELLDSTARFESGSTEMNMLRAHPNYGAKLLNGMGMPNNVINMCLCHHVKMDESLNNSYPGNISYEKIGMECKLLAIGDIYQALVGKRNYKRSWTPPQVMRYLYALSGIEYEDQLWNMFLNIMGEYPVGSLVVLSDDSIGFVMTVPGEGEDLTRPRVAVVRNAYGEDFEKHTLIDLQEEQDIFIKNDLDAAEVFGNQALKHFTDLQIVS